MKKYIKPTGQVSETEAFDLMHGSNLDMHDGEGINQMTKQNSGFWEDDYADDSGLDDW